MSSKISQFLLLFIISLKRVHKIIPANQQNCEKKILTVTMVSLVVVKQYQSDLRDHINVIRCVAFVHCCSYILMPIMSSNSVIKFHNNVCSFQDMPPLVLRFVSRKK